MRSPRGEGQELLAGTGVVANQPVQRRGHGLGAELLHAAQRHAHVLGLQDHADALGLELALEPVGDLVVRRSWIWRSRANSSTTRPSLLRPMIRSRGQIPDVRDPVEGQQVVHAQRVKRDRPCDDQLVMAKHKQS